MEPSSPAPSNDSFRSYEFAAADERPHWDRRHTGICFEGKGAAKKIYSIFARTCLSGTTFGRKFHRVLCVYFLFQVYTCIHVAITNDDLNDRLFSAPFGVWYLNCTITSVVLCVRPRAVQGLKKTLLIVLSRETKVDRLFSLFKALWVIGVIFSATNVACLAVAIAVDPDSSMLATTKSFDSDVYMYVWLVMKIAPTVLWVFPLIMLVFLGYAYASEISSTWLEDRFKKGGGSIAQLSDDDDDRLSDRTTSANFSTHEDTRILSTESGWTSDEESVMTSEDTTMRILEELHHYLNYLLCLQRSLNQAFGVYVSFLSAFNAVLLIFLLYQSTFQADLDAFERSVVIYWASGSSMILAIPSVLSIMMQRKLKVGVLEPLVRMDNASMSPTTLLAISSAIERTKHEKLGFEIFGVPITAAVAMKMGAIVGTYFALAAEFKS